MGKMIKLKDLEISSGDWWAMKAVAGAISALLIALLVKELLK